MMILAIAVSTMITVAIVVFAMQYYSYRKSQSKQEKLFTRKGAVGTQESPMAS